MSYAASKAATDHVVGMLAAKVGRFGIRVNGINPGCLNPQPLIPSPPHPLIPLSFPTYILGRFHTPADCSF
jgi:NAD(P)-dependent dehydrogenase (short-subunit alcohol dehydrogenase family)